MKYLYAGIQFPPRLRRGKIAQIFPAPAPMAAPSPSARKPLCKFPLAVNGSLVTRRPVAA